MAVDVNSVVVRRVVEGREVNCKELLAMVSLALTASPQVKLSVATKVSRFLSSLCRLLSKTLCQLM